MGFCTPSLTTPRVFHPAYIIWLSTQPESVLQSTDRLYFCTLVIVEMFCDFNIPTSSNFLERRFSTDYFAQRDAVKNTTNSAHSYHNIHACVWLALRKGYRMRVNEAARTRLERQQGEPLYDAPSFSIYCRRKGNNIIGQPQPSRAFCVALFSEYPSSGPTIFDEEHVFSAANPFNTRSRTELREDTQTV